MSGLRRVTDEVNVDFTSLFNDPAYIALNNTGSSRLYHWIEKNEPIGAVHFAETSPGAWRSPSSGTFGGYEFLSLPGVERFEAFHRAVEEELRAAGARSIEIHLAPASHDPQLLAEAVYTLGRLGLAITRKDLNYTIAVDARQFDERISYGNRKRLRKADREGLEIEELPIERLEDVYAVISENRWSKGFEVSMTLAALERMASRVPDRFRLFGATLRGEMIAAALCLMIRHDLLYVFYWGDRPGHSQLSPVASLAGAIYRHARAHGIRMIDAGTSTVGDDPNFGLIRFKRGLGFDESLKLRLFKSIV